MAVRAVTYRLDEELLGRLRVRCEELGQPQSVFVRRTLEAALAGEGELPAASPRTPNGKGLLESTEPRRFRCGCATTATSPKAICPKHGKRLAEV